MTQSSENYLNNLEKILQKDLYTTLTGQNPTERVQYLHKLVYCLEGAYDEEGIRIWFQRKRPELGWNSPLEYLGAQWNPKDERAQEVLNLARSLLG